MRAPRLAAVLAALALAATIAAAPSASTSPGVPRPATSSGPLDSETDCLEFAPDLGSASQGSPGGDGITLDVRVLLDGVDASLAVALMAKAAESYKPMNITFAETYEGVSFQGTNTVALLTQAKQHVGARPKGVDVVALLTSKDVEATVAGRSVAGQADCIGGIELPDHSFMVAEARPERPVRFGAVNFFLYAQARVVAHEIGHLLGAHHHYSNCVEGLPSEALELEASPCTLMINDVGLASMNFSTLNAMVVRGHAARFARP